jgi:hypothetical protein
LRSPGQSAGRRGGTTDVVPARPGPPELHGVKSPDRLTRTSGGIVIVEVRPAGEPARVLARPEGFPLRNLTPYSSGGSRLIIERRSGVVRGEDRKGEAPLRGRDSLCVASRPSALLGDAMLHAGLRMPPFSDTPLPRIRLRHLHFPTAQPICFTRPRSRYRSR